MFYKSIFQGRLQFNNERSFDKALHMFHHRLENYHKSTEIIFEEEDIFDREKLQVYVPRTVVNIIEKAYKSTANMLEYISQFAVSGYIGTWMMDDRDIKYHAWMEPESDKTIVQRYLEGKKLTRNKSYKEAHEKLTQVINLYENHSQAYERRGYVNYKLQRYSDAIRDFNKSVLHDDQNAMAYLGLGKLYIIKEEWKTAIKNLESCTKYSLALQDMHWTARRLKAQAHIALKEYKKAEFELRFFLKRDFDEESSNLKFRPKMLESYGIVQMELENHEKAVNYFSEIIDKYHDDKNLMANAYFYRGQCKVNLGENGHIFDFKEAANLGHKRAEVQLSGKKKA